MKRSMVPVLCLYLGAMLFAWVVLVFQMVRVAHAEDCDPTRFSCPNVPHHVERTAPDGTRYETSEYSSPEPPAPMPLPLDNENNPSGAALDDQDEPNPLFYENGGGR